MASEFNGKNNLKPIVSFFERKKYKERISNAEVDFLDTWYEMPNYGLYNEFFEPVVLLVDDENTTLEKFGDYAAPELRAATFVVKAFNEFRDSYRAISENTAIPYPPFLDGLIPVKAYVNFNSSYQEYIRTRAEQVVSDMEVYESRIKDFSDFMTIFKQVAFHNLAETPISRSGFLHSSNCPINVSGLCVELADLPYDIDSEKASIVQTREFLCYSDLAKESGFYVDKNAPWRLIANLESAPMQEFIKEYQENTTYQNVLSRIFRTKTHYDDYEVVKLFVEGIYNNFLSRNPIYSYVSRESGTEVKRNAIRPSIPNNVEIEYWLATLLEVRMMELKMDMSRYEKRKREVLDTHSVYSVKYKTKLINQSLFFSLKPALGKIGMFCAEHVKSVYQKKANTNSYKRTNVKDYS